MTYDDAVSYVENMEGHGSKLGLKRVYALLSHLKNPQKGLKIIHVAGTNGKGSTCAMLSSILREAGYKVGIYTSPHLISYNERYVINNDCISNADFAAYVTRLSECYNKMKADKEETPTVFEMMTALAFIYFAEQKVDILLLEVGLGGRFDATNVIESPILSIITSIGMDHMDYLGNSLSGIAMEKGGIIKEGRPVVLYTQQNEVVEVIKKIAKDKNAALFYAENQHMDIISQDLRKTVFSLKNEYVSYESIEMGLLGDYQLMNCATVLLSCEALKQLGIILTQNNILNGIKKARWDGRMEFFCGTPPVLMDGAHNTDGITMLAKSIKTYFQNQPVTLLIGVLGDKEYLKMLALLLPLAKNIVVTEPNNPRALPTDCLAALCEKFQKPVYKDADIGNAFEKAKEVAGSTGVVCCAGSLYLIGEIRRLMTKV